MGTRAETGAKVLRPAFKWHGPSAYAGDLGAPFVATLARCRACSSSWHAIVRADGTAVRCPCCRCADAVTVAALVDA